MVNTDFQGALFRNESIYQAESDQFEKDTAAKRHAEEAKRDKLFEKARLHAEKETAKQEAAGEKSAAKEAAKQAKLAASLAKSKKPEKPTKELTAAINSTADGKHKGKGDKKSGGKVDKDTAKEAVDSKHIADTPSKDQQKEERDYTDYAIAGAIICGLAVFIYVKSRG